MKYFFLTYLTVLISFCTYSQTDIEIDVLKNQRKEIESKVKGLKDSINSIDLKIAQLNSKKFLDKIKDSTLTAIARKGAKLKMVQMCFLI